MYKHLAWRRSYHVPTTPMLSLYEANTPDRYVRILLFNRLSSITWTLWKPVDFIICFVCSWEEFWLVTRRRLQHPYNCSVTETSYSSYLTMTFVNTSETWLLNKIIDSINMWYSSLLCSLLICTVYQMMMNICVLGFNTRLCYTSQSITFQYFYFAVDVHWRWNHLQ